MNIHHVSIERRFANFSEKHLVDTDFLSIYGENISGSLSWDDFKDNCCVVVLADGKCGKTHEFKRRNEKLRSNGNVSFFIPLEQLQDSEVLDILSDEEEHIWEDWLKSPDQTAVFFLDAVDELKLRQGTLRKALRKVKNTLGDALSRAKFFISCRPSDWNEELDVKALLTILPPEKEDQTQLKTKGEEQLFLQVISLKERPSNNIEHEIGAHSSSKRIRVLSLLPFTPSEALKFAKLYSPSTSEQFNRELSEKELWHLYRSPYEIMSALDQLKEQGKLGNLEEQLVYGINQKLREISDKKRNSLSQEKALDGAIRVALALFMTKTSSIRSTFTANKESTLNIQEILTDWKVDECEELLGKPIFDPTGVGTFKFHHRSTQEYLAALHLKKLRESGLKINDLFSLLFARVKNEKVVIPSMEPVTAWLALWYPDIYNEVKVRNPSLMFRQGIPALLTVEYRADLIRKYVDMYSEDETWRGIRIDLSELKRLSTPELSPVIHELWDKAYSGIDTRKLLLELIYLTPMPMCTDLALNALFDEGLNIQQRTYAGWSVLEFGQKDQREKVRKAVLKGEWPQKLVRNLLRNLIPDAMCVHDFLAVAKFLPETPNNIHGLGFSIKNAIKSKSLSDEQKYLLRDELAQAIWDARCAESCVYNCNSKYNHFVSAVIQACFLTVPDEQENAEKWAWCLAVAFHFGESRACIIARDETETLVKLLSQNLKLREAYYWACLCLVEELESDYDFIYSDYPIDYKKILSPFTTNDLLWLERAFIESESKNKKDAAFHQIIQLVKAKSSRAIEFLTSSLSEGTKYTDIFERTLTPLKQEPDDYELSQKMEKFAEEEAKRVDDWKGWRNEVLASEDFCLGEDRYKDTIYNLFVLLEQSSESSTWVDWDSNLIERTFSKKFVDALLPRLSNYWKVADVQLYSERDYEAKDSFSNETLMALMAVKCESESKNWPTGLTNDQVRQAIRISTLELNKFANYLHTLTDNYRAIVEEVFTLEAEKQLEDFSELGKAPILLEALNSDYNIVKKSVIKAILTKLDIIEVGMIKGSNTDLKYAFVLVAKFGTDTHKSLLAEVVNCFISNCINSVEDRNAWVKRLVNLDLVKGCDRIIEFTEDKLASSSLELFANIFGDRHGTQQLTFEHIVSTQQRLAVLKPLVIRAYEVVHPSLDIVKEGSYSPGLRDFAMRARSFLLESLLNTESPHTIDTLYEFSAMPLFHGDSCSLKQASVELAARISEPNPMPVEKYNQFNKERNYQPYDDRSLFMVMNNRLDDFEHSLLNDEASIVDTLRKVDGETELRRFISNHLYRDSRGAYSVTQEAVVAAEKRTDIRLNVDRIDRYASIELKLDDSRMNWSGSALRVALVDQLVGRYLNHKKCYVGCLLICMRESRNWFNPDTGERMDLEKTVSWLQCIADEIVSQRPELLVSVKGVDYSKIANE
ncbi:hypothetical protein UA38_19955 [Photobacterium kishitanii]|uniref:ATP-binding protein n=3 Tax=Photobacterium kishitanii TaxID=318456 RepID=A0AAX0YS90_9GAMM|nr:hypothetical protein UA38_19955 [Photobacterium kishitanii]KJG63423.1 hypothetical protein UA40_22055 [Photobacterium kishitanii]KJG66563.1 hypothetical protein UA41_20710 [Photobacterium kishitanii]PSX18252.1 hypothetical protein C0W70_15370 [Photobacterium kishitanii]PSX26753.1 hypothetical protein C0W52_16305 [Photobacterium kishitanii]